ncbi:MAG: metallophosphoesterase [Acidimicrobiales bacterium]|nr:metallophosphoesterase [Acidimicrobiales bacterium]
MTTTPPPTEAIEVTTVGPDLVVLHRGAEHRAFHDLQPGTVHDLDGTEVRTLDHPGGELLCRFATVNDVHFGETRCGVVEGHEDSVGPILSSAAGEPPYPVTMNSAAVSEIAAIDPVAVLAKGDLTTSGLDDEYQAFLDCYATAFGERLFHVRGNHDAYEGQSYADDPMQRIDLPGVTLALLDTTTPRAVNGRLTADQLAWLDDLAGELDKFAADEGGRLLVFGHHHPWDPSSDQRPEDYFGIRPDPSEALVSVAARHRSILGYFAGHTHRNRVRRFAGTGAMPWAEVACVKDFPGAWAEYRVYEGGILQLHHRISTPEALDWTERTRGMFLGTYADYAFGTLADRCFPVTR